MATMELFFGPTFRPSAIVCSLWQIYKMSLTFFNKRRLHKTPSTITIVLRVSLEKCIFSKFENSKILCSDNHVVMFRTYFIKQVRFYPVDWRRHCVVFFVNKPLNFCSSSLSGRFLCLTSLRLISVKLVVAVCRLKHHEGVSSDIL